ncbi:hypothetical protein RB2150_15286 [Rhodobacteraceae bacterium HTCC2150]|jgi:hypothetical protein|nr:hypothetical protein RB2150_15286 [Rhodobacteraceae bacterium HTCC2150]
MNRFAAIFLFVVTACVAEADDGVVNNEAEEWACVEKGGRYEIGGILGRNNCVLPTADAGKMCTQNSDCDSFCLAETQTCAPETPMFGCFDVLVESSQKATLCVD